MHRLLTLFPLFSRVFEMRLFAVIIFIFWFFYRFIACRNLSLRNFFLIIAGRTFIFLFTLAVHDAYILYGYNKYFLRIVLYLLSPGSQLALISFSDLPA